MKEELKNLLLKNSRNSGDYIPDYKYNDLINDIVDYINTRQFNEWVSVEDVLPPINKKIDVWDSYHNIRIADYGPFISSWEDDFRKEVMLLRGHTHWQPLPEPPKED